MDALWSILPPPVVGAFPVVLLGATLLFVSRWRSALIWSVALTAYFAAVLLWLSVLSSNLSATEARVVAKGKASLIGAAAPGLLFPTIIGVRELAKAGARKRLERTRGFPLD